MLDRRDGRVGLVRLVCSLKAAAMLGERRWTQKPMRSRRHPPPPRGEKGCYWHARWAVSVMVSRGTQTSHIRAGNVRPGDDVCFEWRRADVKLRPL